MPKMYTDHYQNRLETMVQESGQIIADQRRLIDSLVESVGQLNELLDQVLAEYTQMANEEFGSPYKPGTPDDTRFETLATFARAIESMAARQ